jgi:molybdopterin-biosynthesis enzyme MoeA-like protein
MHSTNPWPLVRWAAAALIYLGTLAIAWDQIAMRQAKIAELERWQKETRQGLAKLAAGSNSMNQQAGAALGKLYQIQRETQVLSENADTAMELLRLLEQQAKAENPQR